MPTLLTVPAPREIRLESVPSEPLRPGRVRLQTLFSGLGAGAELLAARRDLATSLGAVAPAGGAA